MKRILNMLGLAPSAPASVPASQVVEIPSARPFVNQPALDAASKRLGMWVVVGDAVGILTGARIDGLAEVTLQKPCGGTKMTLDENDAAVPHVVVREFPALRQAHIHEIPEARRGDPAKLAALGYQN